LSLASRPTDPNTDVKYIVEASGCQGIGRAFPKYEFSALDHLKGRLRVSGKEVKTVGYVTDVTQPK
jgi:hypothetical protein